MDSKAVTEKYNKCQAAFVAMRAKEEVKFNTYFERISAIDPTVFEGKVDIPKNATLKLLVPEYYAEQPRQQVLDEQIDKANELCSKINDIIMTICEEAYECYSEYQVLASGN